MSVIGIEFNCDDASERVASGNGEVTPNGNYYREIQVTPGQFATLRNRAESDPDATIQMVEL